MRPFRFYGSLPLTVGVSDFYAFLRTSGTQGERRSLELGARLKRNLRLSPATARIQDGDRDCGTARPKNRRAENLTGVQRPTIQRPPPKQSRGTGGILTCPAGEEKIEGTKAQGWRTTSATRGRHRGAAALK
ncbi:hypothetical protein NDU88_005815 [Pleurodeles waltl]|uniref:Uncharacterized protein n=1 Tax=Pleurodeles waltl TaxID=8319 RepID=A0AAV7TCH6_PLEWA|nr:hypothetical protein NDU88_005815 [Pleurodeles waltl]